jgi:hypothetical protein
VGKDTSTLQPNFSQQNLKNIQVGCSAHQQLGASLHQAGPNDLKSQNFSILVFLGEAVDVKENLSCNGA